MNKYTLIQHRKAPVSEAVLIFVLASGFYHLFLVVNFSAAHDAINYLNSISKGENLFHQHHLLYNYTAYQYFRVLRLVFTSTEDYFLIESFTALWGAASLAVSYHFLRNRLQVPKVLSIAIICTIAFSFGFWFYSTNVEVYTVPIFFLMVCLYVLSSPKLMGKHVLAIGVFHSLAILFHQVNILFLPVVVVTLAARRTDIPAVKSLLLYFLTVGLIVGSLYLYIGIVVEDKTFFNEWFTWVKGYTEGHSYWRPLTVETPLNVAVGYSHSLIGGHFFFQVPFVKSLLTSSITDHGLQDEVFLAKNISSATAYSLLACTLMLAGIFSLLVFKVVKQFRSAHRQIPTAFNPLIFALVVYSAFFFFWMPEILEFWIFQSMIIWLIIGGVLAKRKDFRILILTLLSALLLFIINYFGSIRWLGKLEYDWYYQQSITVKQHIGNNDLLVVQDPWIFQDYMSYFLQIRPLTTNMDRSTFLTQLQEKPGSGGKVLFFRVHNNAAYEKSPLIDSIISANPSARLVTTKPEIWVIE